MTTFAPPTQPFLDWFKGSTVVDAEGAPLLLYHGTRSDIEKIDMSASARLPGFWMTPDPKLASTYAAEGVVNASRYREGANVMPVFAKIERPRIYHPKKESMQHVWADYMGGDFDGFVELDNEGAVYAMAVKSSSQVKSATGNNGDFDVANPDIRFSMPEQLMEIGAQQTGSARFDAWFEGSKVTQPNGQPLVVYHGTRADIEVFSSAFDGSRSGVVDGQGGFYFSGRPDTADFFAGKKDGSNVMPVYLQMKKPMIVAMKWWQDDSPRARRDLIIKAKAAGNDGVIIGNIFDRNARYPYENLISKKDTVYIVFSATQIKSSISNNGDYSADNPNIRFSQPEEISPPLTVLAVSAQDRRVDTSQKLKRPTFKSGLQRAIESASNKLANQTATQWQLWLAANAGKLGVKKDEIQWSGIYDYLVLRGSDQVTRAEIVGYLANNGVKIEEVIFGELPNKWYWREATGNQTFAVHGPFDTEADATLMATGQMEYINDAWVPLDLKRAVYDRKPAGPGDGRNYSKYGQHVVPGGSNYREVLLKLPQEPSRTVFKVVNRKAGVQLKTFENEDSAKNFIASWGGPGILSIVKKDDVDAARTFRSGHWNDVPNILAHLRVDDRTDADGKSVLMIHEIQSDWAQKGRQDGFAGVLDKYATDMPGWSAMHNSERNTWTVTAPDGKYGSFGDSEAGLDEQSAIRQGAQMLMEHFGGVPPAPFVTTTKAWVSLALKRAIMMAVEGDYDRVAFITGEQAAGLYDLSKQVSRIEYELAGNAQESRDGQDSKDARFELLAYDHQGEVVIQEDEIGIERVEALVGKEIAAKITAGIGESTNPKIWSVFESNEKLFESEIEENARAFTLLVDGNPVVRSQTANYRDWRVLSGLNLEVGGEGMKAFYDELVPQIANDVLKKLGGGKVGEVELYQADDAATKWRQNFPDRPLKVLPQQGFEITPAMREAVSEGVMLFSRPDTSSPSQVTSIPAGLVDRGYMLIPRGDARRFKGFGTWEKNGVRVALSGNLLMTDKRGDVTIYSGDDEAMTLEALITDSDQRRQGRGRAALLDVMELADTLGQTLYLEPVPLEKNGDVDLDTLKRLYASVGFAAADARGKVMMRMPSPAPATSLDDTTVRSLAGEKLDSAQPLAFNAWFARSVVTTTDGLPLQVFHATRADFTVFDPLRSSPSSRFGPGLYFTSDPKTLDVYADSKLPAEGGQLMPVYLQIERPQRDGALTTQQVNAFFAALQVKQFPNGYDAAADHERIKTRALDDLPSAFNTLLSGQVSFIAAADWLRGMDAMGVDGIIREVFGHPEYVAFKPEQVKSAIANSGQYDTNNPDIRFSATRERQASTTQATTTRAITAYHGTAAQFKRFRISKRGTFGAGIYFGDEHAARSYADGAIVIEPAGEPRVVSVRLYFENPLQVVADYGLGEVFDFDSPAVPLLQRLFGDRANALIESARSNDSDGAFGEEIRREAMRQGFDALILTYPDNSMEYVAFHDRQVQPIGAKLLQNYDSHRHLAMLSSFAGPGARTAPAALLVSAQTRVASGDDAERVRRDTGWFIGMDSQWRYEISDEGARVLPLLANLNNGGFASRAVASVTHRRGEDGTIEMTLNPPLPKTVRDFVQLKHLSDDVVRAMVPPQLAEDILAGRGRPDFIGDMEDAHCIDFAFEFEGFNCLPLSLALSHPALLAAYPDLANIAVRVDPHLYLGASLGSDDSGQMILTVGAGRQVSALLHEVQHAIQSQEGFAEGGFSPVIGFDRLGTERTSAEIEAADYYHRLAGEVEARNTQVRADFTAAERQKIAPLVTQDLPRAEVIVPAPARTTEPAPASAQAQAPAMATPDSVRAAIAALLGKDSGIQATGDVEILVTTSGNTEANESQAGLPTSILSHSLVNRIRKQNQQLTHHAATLIVQSVVATTAQAFFDNRTKTITMVADRIRAGQESAVLLHEMTHKFGRTELGEPSWRELVDQVKAWGDAAPDSNERKVYNQALRRTASVRGLAQNVEVYDEELFAYAVESAINMGIQPSVHALPHSTERWLASVVSSIERIGEKLTGKSLAALSSQDIVDLAYALAQMETPAHAAVIREALFNARLSMNNSLDAATDVNDAASVATNEQPVLMHSHIGKSVSWYSALARAIEASPMKSGGVQAWRDLIRSLPQNGVKPEEIQWSGVQDWLSSQTMRVTKTDIMNYLSGSSVEVHEVFFGGDAQTYLAASDRLQTAGFELDSDAYFGVNIIKDGLSVNLNELSSEQRADFEIVQSGMDAEAPFQTGSARYSDRQQPGGQRYREMLLVMPCRTTTDQALAKRLAVAAVAAAPGAEQTGLFCITRDGLPMDGHLSYPSEATAIERIARLTEKLAPVYSSPHWAGANVLAHVRFNERVDEDGQRCLFVEEIQSDWGQQGRKRGFVSLATTIDGLTADQWQARAQNMFGKWKLLDDPLMKEWAVAITNAKELRARYEAMKLPEVVEIPSGPFVTSTQNWLNLALKRVMGYAVEHGFDKVAFASGDQNTRLFGTEKRVVCLNWARKPDGNYSFDVRFDGRIATDVHTDMTPDKLADHLGKTLAEKITSSPDEKGSLLNVNERIDTDGMCTFYDVILPGAMRNLVHRMSGDGLCEVNIDIGGVMSKQSGYEVTPALREMVMLGMPLFSYPERLDDSRLDQQAEPDGAERVQHGCV